MTTQVTYQALPVALRHRRHVYAPIHAGARVTYTPASTTAAQRTLSWAVTFPPLRAARWRVHVPVHAGAMAPLSVPAPVFLGDNALFIDRIRTALIVYCNGTVIPESMTSSYHEDRYELAVDVMNNPDAFKARFAQDVATDANVKSDATASGTIALTTANIDARQAAVTDGHIDAAVAAEFNSFVDVTA